MSPCWSVVVAVTVLLGSPSPAADQTRSATGPAHAVDRQALAERTWRLTDAVLDHHLEAPARQHMLLGILRSICPALQVPPPADLGRRVSAVTTATQWAALVSEVLPASSTARPGDLEVALWRGFITAVPGGAEPLPAKEIKVREQINNNRYVGTGIQLSRNDKEDLVQINRVFPDSPAAKAGILAEDLILEVDGTPVKAANQGIRKVVDLIRGAEGTPVTLTVRQPGTTEKRQVTMLRGVVPFTTAVSFQRKTAKEWTYRPDPALPVGYVRLLSIKGSTLHELRQIERQLHADGCRALVLDLRFVAEGPAQQAALVADGLLDGGVLWRVRSLRGLAEVKADRNCIFRSWPMAVLIHGSTNGVAAEALAGALQDHRRAILVGEPTAGNLAVRDVVVVAGGEEGLILPTGRVERVSPPPAPADRAPGDSGKVHPDHVVPLSMTKRDLLIRWQEGQESGHAPVAQPEDPQLARALELLKQSLTPVAAPAKSP